MSDTHEVNLLRNVNAIASQSSVSKEFPGLKRNQSRDSRKKRGGYAVKIGIPCISGHGDCENKTVNEQEGTIDITI
jgi:hypothetical protein